MLKNLLIHRTPGLVLLILNLISLNFSLMAESKDLPKDLTNRITISIEKVSLKSALDQISKKGKVPIIYSNSKELTSTIVSLNAQNRMLKDIFNDLLAPLPFDYKVVDDKIVISHDPKKIKRSSSSQVNSLIPLVKGTVTDIDGNPIPGATVKVKDGQQATATDKTGLFFLKNVDEGATIAVSVIGYSPKEIIAAPDMGIISLEISSSKLDEVKINAGYYKVSDRERTGSISKVSAATIEQQPVNNPLQALEGRIPGLQITQLTGVPGGGFSVQIRGRNSINTQVTNDPLYIIDGVTYPSIRLSSSNSSPSNLVSGGTNPLSMINPDDIESIEVLKDADATAIYGSRGGNGVILITTKKGKSGYPKINAGFSNGYSAVGHQLELLNTEQYIQMRKEAFKNDGLTPSALDYDVNGTWDQNKYTNWEQQLIGGHAEVTNSYINLSGGNSSSNYIIGGNYYSEGTVFPGDFNFQRGGIHSSLTINPPKSKFSTTLTINYSHTASLLPTSEPTINILRAPNAPDSFDQYGKLLWTYNGAAISSNPMATLLNTINAKTDEFLANIDLSYKLTDNLVLKTSVGYNSITRNELRLRPLASIAPSLNPTTTSRNSYFGNNLNNSWIAEPKLEYQTNIGPGKLEALAGLSFQDNETVFRDILASGFNSDDLMNNIVNAAALTNSESTTSQYKYTAVYTRLNYSLLSKYYLNLTARRDGSSRFGPGNQFANFGAVGGAWVFSEEKVIKDKLPFLSFGKLRASYGVTGNDQIPDYGYLQLWSSNLSYQGISTIGINRISNPNYSWETTTKAELALQLAFFHDRLNIESSWYQNRSSNQLVGLPLPPSTGTTTILANLPAVVQNRGWEFLFDLKILKQKDWEWTSSMNLTIPKNELLSYPGLATSTYATTYIVGQPLSVRRYYNTTVNPQTGLYTFEDKDGSGTLNDNDKYINKFIGQIFYGGFQNTIRFKAITLNMLLAFVKQNGLSYMSTSPLSPGYADGSGNWNQPTAVLQRWQNPGNQTGVQKYSTSINSYVSYLTASGDGGAAFTDASYIRLKNISLAYALPKELLNKVNITNAELSFQGQNLLTLTHYIGLDPENQNLLNLPPLRTFSLALKLTF